MLVLFAALQPYTPVQRGCDLKGLNAAFGIIYSTWAMDLDSKINRQLAGQPVAYFLFEFQVIGETEEEAEEEAEEEEPDEEAEEEAAEEEAEEEVEAYMEKWRGGRAGLDL